jgi:hypothetical protein
MNALDPRKDQRKPNKDPEIYDRAIEEFQSNPSTSRYYGDK